MSERKKVIGCLSGVIALLAGAVFFEVRHPEQRAHHDAAEIERATEQTHGLSGEMERAIERIGRAADTLKVGTAKTSWLDSRHAAMDYIVNTTSSDADRRKAIGTMREIDGAYLPAQRAKPTETREEQEDARTNDYDD
jgi:hypothetical protein